MAESKRSAKRRKLDFTEKFEVVVGADLDIEPQSYMVHKDVLVKSSDFFRKAVKKEWKEGETKVINLPESQPAAFEVYLQYLYTGDIVASSEEIQKTDTKDMSDQSEADITKAQDLLVDTYILAEMLLDIEAKNALVDEFELLINSSPTLIAVTKINDIFQATPGTSPLRRLLIDFVAFDSSSKSFAENGEEFTSEILVQICVALMETGYHALAKRALLKHSKCKYHEHDGDAHPRCE